VLLYSCVVVTECDCVTVQLCCGDDVDESNILWQCKLALIRLCMSEV
jgi:hypothetical protein